MAKNLKTLKETSKLTGVGLSTIRKYIGEFEGLIPVEKGPRNALLFDSGAIKALKTIREGYQAKKTREEIIKKLSGTESKKVISKSTPVAAGLKSEETIMKGYEDQQSDQGLW